MTIFWPVKIVRVAPDWASEAFSATSMGTVKKSDEEEVPTAG
jgi:hypothetical protein